MHQSGLRAQVGYRRRPRHKAGIAHALTPNHLQRKFNPASPNERWVTDITYIHTHERWLYLAW